MILKKWKLSIGKRKESFEEKIKEAYSDTKELRKANNNIQNKKKLRLGIHKEVKTFRKINKRFC